MANRGLATLYARLHIRCVCFAHFSSGYRRQHDLHAALQECALQGSTQLFVISVDLCAQKQQAQADLSSDGSTKFWAERVRSGQLVGAGGGRETYSVLHSISKEAPRPFGTKIIPVDFLHWGENFGDRLQ